MEYQMNLRGWKAVAVAAAILGITAYQCATRIQTVDDAARQTLHTWLVREYQGKGLHQLVDAYLKHKAGVPEEPAPADTPAPAVEFVSLKAHGSKDNLVVRAEITMNDGPPNDGRPVRYLRMMRSVEGRWIVVGDSTSLDYSLTLLSPVLPRRRY
jgi:hypothetical protein